MTVKRTAVGWMFGVTWFIATALGWTVGLAGGSVVSLVGCFAGCIVLMPESAMACGMGCGLGILVGACFWGGALSGVAQWLLLRRRLPRAGWWIAASALGWVGAAVAGVWVALTTQLLPPDGVVVATLLGGGCAFGAIRGAALWLVLRRHVSGPGWWVLMTAVGWAAVPLGTYAVAVDLREWWMVALSVLGLTGVISSLVISRLLGRRTGVRVGDEVQASDAVDR